MPYNPYLKKLSLLLLSVLFFQHTFSQGTLGCPPNLDFEAGNLSNWQCFIGNTSASGTGNHITLFPTAPTPGYHELISDPNAKDYYGNFPQLCPYGGKYSVKLGNTGTGAQAEGMSYTFTVPSTVDTFTFTYFYAVVFQDPEHGHTEQPRFFVTAYDVLTGDLINCASYDYVATSSLPGFKVSPNARDVLYKNWSPVSIQFAGLADRQVRLEFKTADCTLGGHFGYAYLDVGTGCSNILATAPYCAETNSVILNAPYGFQSYTWYTSDYKNIIGNEQSLTLTPPPATEGRFYVDLIPYPGFGCRDTAYADVVPLPVPDTPVAKSDYFYCQRTSSQALEATNQPGNDLLWYTTATGGTGDSDPILPPTTVAGTFHYYVTQKVLFGCESLRKEIKVDIIPIPNTSFTINKSKQCLDDNEFIFTNTSNNLSNSTFTWDFGDGQTGASDKMIVTHKYTSYGNKTVKLNVLNAPICAADKSQPVTIVPRPVAEFSFPPVICEAQTPLIIKNNSSVPASLSTLTKWWWDIAGSEQLQQEPIAFIPTTPGPMPVKLVVTTAEGCISDTTSKTIPVHYQPSAAFGFNNGYLCDNETVLFKNLSSIPNAAFPENIVKWSWVFDNMVHSSLQHPALDMAAGKHHGKLIVETNLGCKSEETDHIFEIKPKPNVSLAINDSCVFRLIKYQATDLDHSVVKWKWDLGTGFKEGAPLITKVFSKEGDNPLILISQTGDGCKDTIIRPFSIYDNNAFAGKDTIVAKDEPVQLNANGGPGVTYVWTPSTGLDNTTTENPVATLNIDMLYRMDALTDKGCDSHSQIFIKRYKGPELYIPNAFTPNNDGMNDKLKVFPVGIKQFHSLTIYSRSGAVLYKTNDYKQGWDGTHKGTPMDVGNYIAVAKAIDYKGNAMLQKENVVLIR